MPRHISGPRVGPEERPDGMRCENAACLVYGNAATRVQFTGWWHAEQECRCKQSEKAGMSGKEAQIEERDVGGLCGVLSWALDIDNNPTVDRPVCLRVPQGV